MHRPDHHKVSQESSGSTSSQSSTAGAGSSRLTAPHASKRSRSFSPLRQMQVGALAFLVSLMGYGVATSAAHETAEPAATATATATQTSKAPTPDKSTSEPSRVDPLKLPSPPAPPNPPPPEVDCTQVQCVALTFDDGPGPYTNELLDILNERDAPATFFLLGKNVEAHPDIVKRQVSEGYEIGNHSWDHSNLSKLSPEAIAQQLDSTNQAITNLGAPLPVFIRPPYGAQNVDVMAALASRGEAGIFWNVDTEDWKNRNGVITTERALTAQGGSIVLMHDIHHSTIEAIPGIIDGLRERGYTLVPLSDLMPEGIAPFVGKKMYSQTNFR